MRGGWGEDARPEGTEPPGRFGEGGLEGDPSLPPEGLALAPAAPSLTATYLGGRFPPSRSRSLRQRGSGARLATRRGNFPPPPAPGRGWAPRGGCHEGLAAVGDGPRTWWRGLRAGRGRLLPGVEQCPRAEFRRRFASSAVRGGGPVSPAAGQLLSASGPPGAEGSI